MWVFLVEHPPIHFTNSIPLFSQLKIDMPSDVPSDVPSGKYLHHNCDFCICQLHLILDIDLDLGFANSNIIIDVPSDQPSDVPSDVPSGKYLHHNWDFSICQLHLILDIDLDLGFANSNIIIDVPSDQPSDIPSDVPSGKCHLNWDFCFKKCSMMDCDFHTCATSLNIYSCLSLIHHVSSCTFDDHLSFDFANSNIFYFPTQSDQPSMVPSDEPSMVPSMVPSGKCHLDWDSRFMKYSMKGEIMLDCDFQTRYFSQYLFLFVIDTSRFTLHLAPLTIIFHLTWLTPYHIFSNTNSKIDQPSQVPSKEPSRSPSSIPSDQPSQIPSKEPSRSPSSNPTSSIKPSPTPSARPSRSPAYVNCELSGNQILTANNLQKECNYITTNALKLCIRGEKYCANQSGNLVRDYSNVCCDSCNVYYNDASCFTVTSAPTVSACKSTTIEVKLNGEINENGIKIKRYNPATGKFSITKYAKGRNVFNEANKEYKFDVGCLETDACYRFVFRDKDKVTGASDGFLSGDGYVKVTYGGEIVRFSRFNNQHRSVKTVRIKFGDSCP